MAGLLEDAKAQWGDLMRSFLERVVKPSSRPTAGLYLLLAVAIFGGTSLWVTFALASFDQATPRELALGIVTYAVAIIATSIGDLMLDREATPPLRLLLFAIATVAFFACIRLTYSDVYVLDPNSRSAISLAVLMQCVAPVWATWWLVNGVDDRFFIRSTPKAALGGDAGRPL